MKEYSVENINHKIKNTSKIVNRYSEIKLIISMSGELSLIFKHVALPQFSKGKILTPVCHRQELIPSLVE
jgi:hypothetical protein